MINKYKKCFFVKAPTNETKAARALALALDIRKFETELYWKRATYFWVFTGAALAGYLTALTGENIQDRPQALLLTSCIGLVFAVAWYFVNRASKFWQSNWEAHVDLLEDETNGPIYKAILYKESEWWKPHDPYSFSVSKINQLLSLFIVAIFVTLVVNTLNNHYTFSTEYKEWEFFPTACLVITFCGLILFVWLGRSDIKKNEDIPVTDKVKMHLRKTVMKNNTDN